MTALALVPAVVSIAMKLLLSMKNFRMGVKEFPALKTAYRCVQIYIFEKIVEIEYIMIIIYMI